MRSALQRILHVVIGHDPGTSLDTTTGKLPSMRRRRHWAGSVEDLLQAANQRRASSQFPHPEWEGTIRLRTAVVRACQSELLAIQRALLDQRQPISAQALQQLKEFLRMPGSSPLFGSNPTLARRAARQLQWSFTGRPERWPKP
jgi:hypothetical protein